MRHVSGSRLDPEGLLVSDDAAVILVLVIECEFRAGRDFLQGEEGEVVEIGVAVVVGGREQPAIGIAAVVHESRRTSYMHTVADVFIGDVFRVQPHLLAVLGVDGPVLLLHLLFVPSDVSWEGF